MNVLKVGDIAPDFSCKNQYGELINLSDMKGKKIVVFFYPKLIPLAVLLKLVI